MAFHNFLFKTVEFATNILQKSSGVICFFHDFKFSFLLSELVVPTRLENPVSPTILILLIAERVDGFELFLKCNTAKRKSLD